jgi:hypothetical protein
MGETMKAWAAALLVLGFAGEAVAQPRASTLDMTCNQARTEVARRGAVVLGTGGGTYDRFVSSRNFCQLNEQLQPVWVPTRDAPQCPIGYRCSDNYLWDF